MKIETTKDLAYYEALPYTIIIRRDDEGDFVARIQELRGCIAHGDSEKSALEHLHSMKRLWLEESLSAGDAIPEPEDDADLPSGKWLQRVPKRLHRDLVKLAQREDVSLNQLVTSLLSEAVTMRSCIHVFEAFVASSPRFNVSSYGWGWAEPHPDSDWQLDAGDRSGKKPQRKE